MPVEAMAAGCPVVTLEVGGAAESVMPSISGFHAESATEGALAEAIKAALALDRTGIAETTRRFSTDRFQKQLLGWVHNNER